ncbi:MaoC family dehydratase [Haloarcula sp. S1AR25-5A]|uniref:MaoC family dehydratase n=1 Tax=Haloarcula terrestris TaxID=2950533 RepID=A0AAE4EYU0_9EURY|nr:MaoC family dehydratase [Haloarcula terrestris]MDS0221266.1 MaoC family dehydratase [Haloarcula terrestris]
MKFYEDITVGDQREFGEFQITKDEITEFARKYDPQPFHLDEEAAKESMFGELVASGWQTAAICMRLTVENITDVATLGGLGVDNLRWHEPLRPGDTLHVRTEVLDKRISESRDDRGYVTRHFEGLTEGETRVISYDAIVIVKRDTEIDSDDSGNSV